MFVDTNIVNVTPKVLAQANPTPTGDNEDVPPGFGDDWWGKDLPPILPPEYEDMREQAIDIWLISVAARIGKAKKVWEELPPAAKEKLRAELEQKIGDAQDKVQAWEEWWASGDPLPPEMEQDLRDSLEKRQDRLELRWEAREAYKENFWENYKTFPPYPGWQEDVLEWLGETSDVRKERFFGIREKVAETAKEKWLNEDPWKVVDKLVKQMKEIADPFQQVYFFITTIFPEIFRVQESSMEDTGQTMYDVEEFNRGINKLNEDLNTYRTKKDSWLFGFDCDLVISCQQYALKMKEKGVIDDSTYKTIYDTLEDIKARVFDDQKGTYDVDRPYIMWNRQYLQHDSNDVFKNREWKESKTYSTPKGEDWDLGPVFSDLNVLKSVTNTSSAVAQVDAKEIVTDYNMFLSALKDTAKEFFNQAKVPVRQLANS